MLRRSVMKFGGTSVKNAAAINQVINIIETSSDVRAVVVSAVSEVTNKLVQFFHAGSEQRRSIISEIKYLHLAILDDLRLTGAIYQQIIEKIDSLDAWCDSELKVDRLDEIVSLGEQLSSLILFNALKNRNNAVVLVDAKKIMITDNHHGKATPQLDLIKERCQDMISNLPHNAIIITQGFIGATVDGITTTLGRGGSDFSAALLAEAIHAESLHIYTDVKGVYTMDPNIIKNAERIDRISFQEMAELANFGAKVLHPATLAPCVRAKIPVTILSTFEPSHGGTCITPEDPQSEERSSVVRAIAIRKKQILVTIKSLNMLNAFGFLANVFSILARYKISVDLITTSEVSVALTIDGTNLGSSGMNPFEEHAILNELRTFADILMEENLTLVTVVGEGLTIPGVSQRILGKIIDYSIRLICYGASSSNIGFLVGTDDSHAIVSLLHKECIETNNLKKYSQTNL